jgi:hypothetical protein
MEKNKREGKAAMSEQNGDFNALKRWSRMQQLLKDSLMRIIKKIFDLKSKIVLS